MFYEVTTSSGNRSIIQADTSREAKGILCKQRGIRQSDPWCGVRSMQARKIRVDFPETVYRPCAANLDQMIGKDLVLYDEHHGTSVRIHAATLESIQYFLDEYSSAITL